MSRTRLIRAALGIASLSFFFLGVVSLAMLLKGRESRSDAFAPTPQHVPVVLLNKTVTVKSTEPWQSSGVRVTSDQTVRVEASGKVCWSFNNPDGSGCVGPEGSWYSAGQLSDKSGFPSLDARCGSLIARVGGTIYFIGNATSFSPREEGVVEFMINDRLQWLWDNKGTFRVSVRVEK